MPLGRVLPARPTFDVCALDQTHTHPSATLQIDADNCDTTPLRLCYSCGPSVAALLTQEGYSNVRMTATSIVDTAQAGAALSHASALVTANVPPCFASGTGCKRLGFCMVTYKTAAGTTDSIRTCQWCLWELTELLKAEGATELRGTAPEQPKLAAWKG